MQPLGRFAASVSGWLNASLGFLYPENCQLCGEARATPVEGFICAGCREQVRFIKAPFCERCCLPYQGEITTRFECTNCREGDFHFQSARSAVVAHGPVLDAIHRYKYERALWFEPFLADLLICQAKPELAAEKWDCIVPVPLHSTKQREREFNQAARLSDCLSAATNIPVKKRLVQRVVATRTQTLLSRAERVFNMRKAFATWRDVKLNGEKIVLVDDVFTTGATTSACAKVLLKAGASEVCVWTVARGV